MTCAHIASTCDGIDVKPVKRFMRSTLTPLCRGCRAALDRMGASYTVAEPEPGPRWLANLRAVDLTGRLVA